MTNAAAGTRTSLGRGAVFSYPDAGVMGAAGFTPRHMRSSRKNPASRPQAGDGFFESRAAEGAAFQLTKEGIEDNNYAAD